MYIYIYTVYISVIYGRASILVILPHQEGLASIFGVPERYIDSITFKTFGPKRVSCGLRTQEGRTKIAS